MTFKLILWIGLAIFFIKCDNQPESTVPIAQPQEAVDTDADALTDTVADTVADTIQTNTIVTPEPTPEYIIAGSDSISKQIPKKIASKYSLVEEEASGSSWDYSLEDAKKNSINLPDHINLDNATWCLGIFGNMLTYDVHRKEIRAYFINKKKEIVLHTFESNPPEGMSISSMAFSPNQKTLAAIINMHTVVVEEQSFPNTQIILFFLGEDQTTKVKIIEAPVQFDCGSMCGSDLDEDFFFVDDETFAYKRHSNETSRPREIDLIQLNKL